MIGAVVSRTGIREERNKNNDGMKCVIRVTSTLCVIVTYELPLDLTRQKAKRTPGDTFLFQFWPTNREMKTKRKEEASDLAYCLRFVSVFRLID